MRRFIVVMIALGFVLAFVGIILLIGAVCSIIKVRSFLKCSESITGKVVRKNVHHGNNRRYYSMDINYTVNGVDYKRSIPADLSEYKTLKEGDPFDIKYRSDKPNKIIRVDSLNDQSRKKMRTLLVTSIVMTVIGLALIVICLSLLS